MQLLTISIKLAKYAFKWNNPHYISRYAKTENLNLIKALLNKILKCQAKLWIK